MDSRAQSLRRRPVTLSEIATAAGVSRPTASVVLNGARSGSRISIATRDRVLELAKAMGYRPNSIAQHLATGRANRIGIYCGRAKLDCQNPFFAEILGGVFAGAGEIGFDTLVHTASVAESQIEHLVRAHTVDGLIVYATPGDPIFPLLGDLHVPAVAIADEVHGIPSVIVDDREGGALLAKHLLSLGHRHVLVKQSPAPPPSAIARVKAFVEVFEEGRGKVTHRLEAWSGPSLSEDDIQVLNGVDRATAIMAWSDAVAETVVAHLVESGVSVPGDISVVGFDGFRSDRISGKALTTIRAPWAELGREAVFVVHSQVTGGTVQNLKILPVAFRLGNTTGLQEQSAFCFPNFIPSKL